MDQNPSLCHSLMNFMDNYNFRMFMQREVHLERIQKTSWDPKHSCMDIAFVLKVIRLFSHASRIHTLEYSRVDYSRPYE